MSKNEYLFGFMDLALLAKRGKYDTTIALGNRMMMRLLNRIQRAFWNSPTKPWMSPKEQEEEIEKAAQLAKFVEAQFSFMWEERAQKIGYYFAVASCPLIRSEVRIRFAVLVISEMASYILKMLINPDLTEERLAMAQKVIAVDDDTLKWMLIPKGPAPFGFDTWEEYIEKKWDRLIRPFAAVRK